jgi:hypothetical protein
MSGKRKWDPGSKHLLPRPMCLSEMWEKILAVLWFPEERRHRKKRAAADANVYWNAHLFEELNNIFMQVMG